MTKLTNGEVEFLLTVLRAIADNTDPEEVAEEVHESIEILEAAYVCKSSSPLE